ncbi:3-oxoadipate enol-lactonase [Acetobacter sp. DsW_063]|uniref:3-oxoadipate enol-lactonase n=1 Tax=Acetobacter sp. DsW_063 TaxID=1514894 RepID=UPI000A379D3F|nr:3-oxoadipate enol-lactonase [Acetobacter sp. DsW_063]OUJ11051.1 3-oxoadipate enol-lactonase [Acetobacter sp. DsW_063]
MNRKFLTMGDGCSIAYTQNGDQKAEPLFLSNSLGTCLDMWNPQIARLSEHFHVIRYDTRGHGKSDVPVGSYSLDRLGRDVLELADALEIQQFSFCGLSLGGMTAQWLGVRAPERLKRIVIANSSPYMGPPSAWDARIHTVLNVGMSRIAEAVVERWFTQEFRNNRDNTKFVLDMLLHTNATGYAGCCAAIRDMDLRPLLPLIRTPTLIIGGTEDPATPPEQTYELRDGIRSARCVMLEAAHLSNIEKPSEFTDFLISHFV